MSEMAELDGGVAGVFGGEGQPLDLLITRIDNGFLLTHKECGEIKHFSIQDYPDDATKTTQELLQEVMWYFNLAGSRYDEKRVSVVIVKGDKCE